MAIKILIIGTNIFGHEHAVGESVFFFFANFPLDSLQVCNVCEIMNDD